MLDDEERHARRRERLEPPREVRLLGRREARRRLVEDEERGLEGERPRDLHPPPGAGRQLARRAHGPVRRTHRTEVGDRLAPRPREGRPTPPGRPDPACRRHVVKGAYSQNTGGSGILPCYLGYFVPIIAAVAGPDVEPVRTSVDWLLRHQRFDHKETRAGGDEEWPFRTPINYGCWFSVSCYHGVAAALRAIASIPAAGRPDVDRRRLDEAVAYLRIHRVYKKSAVDKPLFRHLTQFFLHGGYRFHLIDVLEGLAWTDPALGRQEWVAEAIEAVDALAPDGRIRLVKNYPTHLIDPIPLEPVGEPSRFLTYQWLRTKRRFGLP